MKEVALKIKNKKGPIVEHWQAITGLDHLHSVFYKGAKFFLYIKIYSL